MIIVVFGCILAVYHTYMYFSFNMQFSYISITHQKLRKSRRKKKIPGSCNICLTYTSCFSAGGGACREVAVHMYNEIEFCFVCLLCERFFLFIFHFLNKLNISVRALYTSHTFFFVFFIFVFQYPPIRRHCVVSHRFNHHTDFFSLL